MDIAGLVALWVVAFAMAVVAAYVIRWAATARSRFDISLAIFLLAMMGSMAGGLLLYEVLPPLWGLEVALWTSMWVMVIGVGQLLSTLVGATKWKEGQRPSIWARSTVIAGAIGTELVMSLAVGLAAGDFPTRAYGSLAALLAQVVTSDWFLFAMSAEMALSVQLARKDLPPFLLVILALQPVVMAFAPTALAPSAAWVLLSVAVGGGTMTVIFTFLLEGMYRGRSVTRGVFAYLRMLLAVFGVMMAGLLLWSVTGDPYLFALSLVGEMVLFFDAMLIPEAFSRGESVNWLGQAWPIFGVVLGIFLAEFFMGGLFDLTFGGADYFARMPFAPLGSTPLLSLAPAVYNGLLFVTGILGSPWFLLMMGLEMGALVVFKIQGTRNRETRVRLALVIGAFFVYTLYLPSFYFGSRASGVPLVGWTMGFGTGGGFIPPLLLAILLTYAISGVLSLLFGARQMCSGLCSAALMYQGTFYDSLKVHNRRSHVGRKLLGSRLSKLYGLVFSLSWASITVAGILSYLTYIGAIHLTVYGTDVAYFTYVLYFDLLWYILFVSMPFVGTYACVSSGYCYWGTFNQMLGKLGFFKLKARDPKVCTTCVGKPCTRACPVGLTDLPVHFMKRGEFKALKCIGVGDCVEACPYDNILFWDVRHWLKERTRAPRVLRTSRTGRSPRPMRVQGEPRGPQPSDP